MAYYGRLARRDAPTQNPQSADQGVKASGWRRLLGEDLRHRAVARERPALARRHITSSGGCLDLPPSAMSGETDHGIPSVGAGSASLAGGVRIGRGADRYSPSGRRVPRQGCCPVTPFADRLGPLIRLSLEPAPNRAAGVSSGEHGHYGRNAQFGEQIRKLLMR
jgi:hypothetical protein